MVAMGISQVQPESMPPPVAKYAHAMAVTAGSDMVFTSGVVPTMPDGTVPGSLEGQARVVWANLIEILRASGMVVSNIVSVTTYVVYATDLSQRLAVVMGVRDEVMGGHRAASTLVSVPGLARPEWLIEISVIAAC